MVCAKQVAWMCSTVCVSSFVTTLRSMKIHMPIAYFSPVILKILSHTKIYMLLLNGVKHPSIECREWLPIRKGQEM